MEISDESVIDQIERKPVDDTEWVLQQIIKPIKAKLNLDEIKKAQNFKTVDKQEVEALIKEANIQESIEALLQMV